MNAIKVGEFHKELDNFLKTMAKKYNFICKKSCIAYDDSGIKVTIETADLDENGDVAIDYIQEAKIASSITPYAVGYTKNFEHYTGLKFKKNGKDYRIVGYNSRARTYPIQLDTEQRAAPKWVADCLIENGLFVKK